MVDDLGLTWGMNPKGFSIFQNKFRYQSLLLSVSPNSAKNMTAKAGLLHWLNLSPKTTPNPTDFHSSAVAVGTDDISEWVALHPGQKVGTPPSLTVSASRFTSVLGNVRRMSNNPSARILWKPLLSRGYPLARASSSSLCLKYVQISLAIFDPEWVLERRRVMGTHENRMLSISQKILWV